MTRADRAGFAAVVAIVAILGPGWPPAAVHAQSAEAEVLFRDGRDLLKQGKLVAGCDKLAASERLESSVGTLLNLGDCREKLGRLASAWAAFRKAEAMAKRAAGDDRRQAEASRRAAQLEPRLPNLEIDVADPVDGLIVRRDGELVGEAQWHTAVPVDPGSYTIVAEAAGYQAWRTTVPIGLGAVREVVVVPRLERIPAAPVPEVSAGSRAAAGQPPVAPVAHPAAVVARGAGTWTPMRKLSVGVALAGAGALVTGVYFGVHANVLEDRANGRCRMAMCADPEGLAWNDQAQTSAWRANLLFIAGGGTLAAAMVLWLVGAPDEAIVVPTAGDRQLGVALSGRF
jgi:hypothetical protein